MEDLHRSTTSSTSSSYSDESSTTNNNKTTRDDDIDVDKSNHPSVAKTLTSLLSIPSNRKCADCGIQIMIDSSTTFASFSPGLGGSNNNCCCDINEFQFNHQLFSPTITKETNIIGNRRRLDDPAEYAVNVALGGGHGVFVCQACSEAHRLMGVSVTIVKPLNDFSLWELEEVLFLQQCGCNTASSSIYEGFIPPFWKEKKSTASSSLKERHLFCRAKYDALAFVTPSGGIFAERAWSKLLQRDKRALDRYLAIGHLTSFGKISLTGFNGISSLSLSRRMLSTTAEDSTVASIHSSSDAGMPNRFVDFFCIVGHNKNKLYPGGWNPKTPEGIVFDSIVADCYPKEGHADMDFPQHISQFVFPDGCRVSETRKPPQLFTFVLTSSSGHRLYGAALKIYDETMETENVKEVVSREEASSSGYNNNADPIMPWWSDTESSSNSKEPSKKISDIVFLPKCLVVLSHYAFFHTFRKFLRELYRMSLLETPLPLERYISNFTSELPLPPQGKVEIKFGFTSQVQCIISRPAPNELPLAKFSYRPLFSCLSVSNVMVVVGLLMEETRVVLLSKYYSLLAPCTEALLSFLFPLEWNGIYIPIMPYTALDILDAPVPFLVGLHSRYLRTTEAKNRPPGVVFVDLDKDIVHLGHEEEMNGGSSMTEKRLPPSLPEKAAAKLKSKLEDFASSAYLMPANGMKGMITYGEGELLADHLREPYVYQETQKTAAESSMNNRFDILEKSENAFSDPGQDLQPIQSFLSEEGQLSHKSSTNNNIDTDKKAENNITPNKNKTTPVSKLLASKRRHKRSPPCRSISDSHNSSLHIVDECSDCFYVLEIRNAFLRFFTSLLNNYDKFFISSNNGSFDLFRVEDFLLENRHHFPASTKKREWMELVLKTQMFQRFLEEREEDSNNASILFFDESVAAKNNRSKKTAIKVGKRTTPFLDDDSWQISDTFTPPAPSNWGLPADGRVYSYPKFPKLDAELFGAVRSVKQWPAEWEQKIQRRGASLRTRRKRKDLMRYELLKASARRKSTRQQEEKVDIITNTPDSSPDKYGEQNLNWALNKLADSNQVVKVMKSNSGQRNSITTGIPLPGAILFAQDIVLASRRKQGILIRRLITFQKEARKQLNRPIMELKKQLSNARMIGEFSRNAVRLQTVFRAHLAILLFQKQRSATSLIQRHLRGKAARIRLNNKKNVALRIQAFSYGRKVRFIYALVKEEIVKIQAVIRRYLIKKHLFALLRRQCLSYKNHIFLLWSRGCIPLRYRSQMWPLFKVSFLSYRFLADEVERMRSIMGIEGTVYKDELFSDDECICDVAGGKAFEIISTRESNYDKEAMSFIGEDSDRVRQGAVRLKAERAQVYERLELLKNNTSDLQNVYKLFGIEPKEKKKKARVLEQLWESVEFADASTDCIRLLFPELGGDIKQVRSSKKGSRRFLNRKQLLSPLEKEHWVDCKIDRLFRKNLSEIALASMQRMPLLFIKLHSAYLHKVSSSWKEQKKAYFIANLGAESWKKKKMGLMKKFLKSEKIQGI